MRLGFHAVSVAAIAASFAAISAMPASAACTRLAFSVNDYGKEGPSNDAKRLLDTYIGKKMQERGVTSYKTGKKDVTCELFLDFIVFDEYTCKAEATVCWDGSTPPGGAQQAVAPTAAPARATATTTGSIDKDAATAPASVPVAAPATTPSPEPVKSVEAPAAAQAVTSAPAAAAPPATVEAVAPADETDDAAAPASVAP